MYFPHVQDVIRFPSEILQGGDQFIIEVLMDGSCQSSTGKNGFDHSRGVTDSLRFRRTESTATTRLGKSPKGLYGLPLDLIRCALRLAVCMYKDQFGETSR